MAMSRNRHLVWSTQSDARNSSADENARTAKPNSLSKSGSDSRMDSSSSTTVTSERLTNTGTRMRHSNKAVHCTLVSLCCRHLQKSAPRHRVHLLKVAYRFVVNLPLTQLTVIGLSFRVRHVKRTSVAMAAGTRRTFRTSRNNK